MVVRHLHSCGRIVTGICPACRPNRPINPLYRTAYWRRRSATRLDQHRRTFGPICPRCGRREDPCVPSTLLTLNHVVPLALGGAIDGIDEVMCRGSNTRKWHRARHAVSGWGRT